MTPIRITFLYEPPAAYAAPGSPTPTVGGPQMYRRLINELAHHSGQPIDVITSTLHEGAPSDGVIVFAGADVRVALNECASETRVALAKRLIPADVSRTRIFNELLEPLSLAGAIDAVSLGEWERDDENRPGARGLYGRRDVGEQVGARCLLYKSERYCYLESQTHRGLPHLVADYIKALAQTVSLR